MDRLERSSSELSSSVEADDHRRNSLAVLSSTMDTRTFREQILRMHTTLLRKDYSYDWWRSWTWQCLSVKASKFRHLTASTPSRIIELIIVVSVLANAAFAMLALTNFRVYKIESSRDVHRYAVQIPTFIVFIVEYIARLWSCVESAKYDRHPFWGRLRWALQPLSLFDFACIVLMAIPMHSVFQKEENVQGTDLWMSLRLLLLLRFERQLKVFKRMYQLFGSRIEELCLSMYFTGVCILLFGVAFYAVEKGHNMNVTSLWTALYWSVQTLTTLGYGDLTPETMPGKLLAGALAFAGFLIFAIPTGIIASGFISIIKESRDRMKRLKSRLVLRNVSVESVSEAHRERRPGNVNNPIGREKEIDERTDARAHFNQDCDLRDKDGVVARSPRKLRVEKSLSMVREGIETAERNISEIRRLLSC